MLLKQLNENGKHRVEDESPDAPNIPSHSRTTNPDSYLNERWRRLPLYNFRRFPVTNDKWLNDLEREQTRSGVDDTADYI